MKLKSIICFLLGHKSEPAYVEENGHIYKRRCSRCKSGLGMSAMWLNMPRCPGTTQADWDEFILLRKEEIRKEVNDSSWSVNNGCYQPAHGVKTPPPADL